jgi:hypothetical protein
MRWSMVLGGLWLSPLCARRSVAARVDFGSIYVSVVKPTGPLSLSYGFREVCPNLLHGMDQRHKRETLFEFHERDLNRSAERSTNDRGQEANQEFSDQSCARLFEDNQVAPDDEPSNPMPIRTPFRENSTFASPEAAFGCGIVPQMPRNQTPWDSYRPVIKVRQGCAAIMAVHRSGDLKRYAISTISRSHKEKYLQALQKLRLGKNSSLVNIIEMMDWKNGFFIVSDYVDVCLAQVLACQKTPEESEVSFVLNEVLKRFPGREVY